MKILIITGIFEPEIGGPATYSAKIAGEFVALGNQVSVLTYSKNAREKTDSKHPFFVKRIVRRNKISNYVRCFWYVLTHIRSYDVVYSLDWFSAGVPLYFASLLTRKKYFVRVGGGYIWEKYLREGHQPLPLKTFYEKNLFLDYRIMYRLVRMVLGRAKVIIFNTDTQADLYKTFYNLNPDHVRVILNPTEAPDIHVVRGEATKEIVFAGRFIAMKNVASLLRAFSALSDKSYRLLLIGEGPEEKKLRALSEALGIDERVTWSPPLPLQKLYERIINCAYVVTPSWTDVSPHQAYECLALHIPILMTKENYLHLPDGILMIDPESVDDISKKMNQLSDPDFYTTYQSQTFSFAMRSWKDVAIQHISFFTTL